MAEYVPSPAEIATLRSRLGAGAERDGELQSALETGHALLTDLLTREDGTTAEVPGPVLREQRLDVAARVFRLRSTSTAGEPDSPMLDGVAASISVDPLYAARTVLSPWTGLGIA